MKKKTNLTANCAADLFRQIAHALCDSHALNVRIGHLRGGELAAQYCTRLRSQDDSFGTRTIIARSISNVASHPGKTLYGCSYRIELLDRDGNPL